MKKLLFLFAITLLFFGCVNDQKEDKKIAPAVVTKPKPQAADTDGINQQDSIKATGRQVLLFLKAKNYPELIKYFSSDGVLFSPYGNIDTLKNKKLMPSAFLEAIQKNWVLTWGSFDGTGDPIKLTIKDYLKKFVYNADYFNPEAVGFDEILKKGNSIDNLKEIYKKNHFIDYHFSGFDQKLDGMDWTSLRLVFEKQNGQYFLVAVVHDQWTI
jgi:hypothetical protein